MTALVIHSEAGRYAGRTTLGAPLMLVAEPYAHLFDETERGQAEVLAANLTASWGERCEVIVRGSEHQPREPEVSR